MGGGGGGVVGVGTCTGYLSRASRAGMSMAAPVMTEKAALCHGHRTRPPTSRPVSMGAPAGGGAGAVRGRLGGSGNACRDWCGGAKHADGCGRELHRIGNRIAMLVGAIRCGFGGGQKGRRATWKRSVSMCER